MYFFTNFENFLFLVIFAISLFLSRKKFSMIKLVSDVKFFCGLSEKLISEPHLRKV